MSERIGKPKSEDDHRVHALNIHGQFFERWCEEAVRTTEKWSVEAVEEAVEFEAASGTIEGSVDLLAERGSRYFLTLPIECKKANPELAQWVFFPHRLDLPVRVRRHRVISEPSRSSGWRITHDTVGLPLAVPLCVAAREVRSDYAARKVHNWSKTSNAAIRDAAEQVATAHRALVDGDFRRASRNSESKQARRWPERRVFIPVIATTAELLVCRFDAGDIDPATGEIPLSSATFEPAGALIYEYPLPPRLQLPDEVSVAVDGTFERSGTRLPVLVINSRDFKATLMALADDMFRDRIFRVD